MEVLLHNYLEMLANMKRSCKNGCVEPYKPVLLLAIQYRIQTGWITDNKIIPDKTLESQFAQFWNLYVDNGKETELMVCEDFCLESTKVYPFKCKMSYPFFHLCSEPFWNLVKRDEWVKRYEYSLLQLRKNFQYAELDIELFELMKTQPYADRIKAYLESMI